MISPKKLIQMAKKWQNLAILRRKSITLPRVASLIRAVDKGHFVVYTCDRSRFVIPLDYLKNDVFRELLKMAEDEYGLPRDGPITLPCDAAFMEYAVSLIHTYVYAGKDLEKTLLMSMSSARCSLSSDRMDQASQQSLLCGF